SPGRRTDHSRRLAASGPDRAAGGRFLSRLHRGTALARRRGPYLAAAVRGRGPSPVRGGYHSFGLRPDLGHPVLPRPVAGRPRPQGAPGTIPRQDVTGQLLLWHLRPGPLPVLG